MENNKPPEIFKVYGLVLEAKEQIFLSIQYALSLEDAFGMAKLEYEKINPTRSGINNPFLGSKIWLFTIKSVTDLVEGKVTLPKAPRQFKRLNLGDTNKVDPVNEKEDHIQKEMINVIKKGNEVKNTKNKLMKKIIDEKNLELFEQNKDLFTPHDVQYIQDNLKKKVKD
ncbi:MAG: hypothetical protein WC917_00345 [Bacilli bacterium]|jgi:hypothetical protein